MDVRYYRKPAIDGLRKEDAMSEHAIARFKVEELRRLLLTLTAGEVKGQGSTGQ
jgi:hypothetical protein